MLAGARSKYCYSAFAGLGITNEEGRALWAYFKLSLDHKTWSKVILQLVSCFRYRSCFGHRIAFTLQLLCNPRARQITLIRPH
jgi:hypothetical protein